MVLSLLFYNLIILLLTPLWVPLSIARNLRRSQPPFGGRFSAADRQALEGKKIIWLHCVLLGKSIVGAKLYRHLAPMLPGFTWVVTTTTLTGQMTIRRLLGQDILLRYFPLDLPWSVRRTVRRIHPDLIILMETELWPNLIHTARRKGIKVAVANGRLSDRTARYTKLLGWILRPAIGGVNLFLMQTAMDAERIMRLGAPADSVRISGSIKYDMEPAAVSKFDRDELGLPEGVPVLVAGSTHRGEEEVLLQALRLLRQEMEAYLILVPRHLERLAEIKTLLSTGEFAWGLRSQPPAELPEVLLIDTYGELVTLYQLANLAFIGGSLVKSGGHNPLEASSVGCPVIFGPHMENFREAQRLLVEAEAAIGVHSAEDIVRVFRDLIKDRERAAEMGRRGRAVVFENRGAAERTAVQLAALMGVPGVRV